MSMITISITDLDNLCDNLDIVSSDLDEQKYELIASQQYLQTALFGDYIATFEDKFASWVQTISKLIDGINDASLNLDLLRFQLEDQIASLNAL